MTIESNIIDQEGREMGVRVILSGKLTELHEDTGSRTWFDTGLLESKHNIFFWKLGNYKF